MHGLNKEQLAARQVEVIDIASAATDYWSYIVGRNDVDLSNFRSARSGRGPLLEGWQVCVSLFTVEVHDKPPYPPFRRFFRWLGNRLEALDFLC